MKLPLVHILWAISLVVGTLAFGWNALWKKSPFPWPIASPTAAVATVGETSISLAELESALRDQLWRQGSSWENLTATARKQLRQQILEQLVDHHLIRQARLRDTPKAVEEQGEMKWWSRQFDPPSDLDQRLQWQRLTQAQMQQRISDAQQDQAWLEEKLAPHLASLKTTDAARVWFDKHRETLRLPTRYHAAHLFLTSHGSKQGDRKKEIENLSNQSRGGSTSFASLVGRFSEDLRTKTQAGNLGWFSADRMPGELIRTLESLPSGQISAPVQTSLGWHLLHLIQRRPSRLPTFEEVRPEIEAWQVTQARRKAVEAVMTNLRAQAAQTFPRIYHPELIDKAAPPA